MAHKHFCPTCCRHFDCKQILTPVDEQLCESKSTKMSICDECLHNLSMETELEKKVGGRYVKRGYNMAGRHGSNGKDLRDA